MLIAALLSALIIDGLGHLLTGLALGQKLKLFIVAFFLLRDKDVNQPTTLKLEQQELHTQKMVVNYI
jgi:hypothetical protein